MLRSVIRGNRRDGGHRARRRRLLAPSLSLYACGGHDVVFFERKDPREQVRDMLGVRISWLPQNCEGDRERPDGRGRAAWIPTSRSAEKPQFEWKDYVLCLLDNT